MEDKNLFVALILLVAAISVISLFVGLGNNLNEQALTDKIAAQVVSELPAPQAVPTAAEIAALVVIPALPEFEVPEFKNDEHIIDLWEDLYAEEIEELETEAYNIAVSEFEEDDYELLEDWFNEFLEDFDELENVEIEDYEVSVISLGLSEDDDKVAEVLFEIEVEYSLNEGPSYDYKKDLEVTAYVVFDEGDFDEEDVEWTFPAIEVVA